MTEFREPVFYVPGTATIIDTAIDQNGILVGAYSKETLEQIQLRYHGAAIGEFDEVFAAAEASLITEPVKITEENFLEALSVLPPVRWTKRAGAETFKISERYYGRITAIYVRISRRYYRFCDDITLSHDQIIERVQKAFPPSTTQSASSETVCPPAQATFE